MNNLVAEVSWTIAVISGQPPTAPKATPWTPKLMLNRRAPLGIEQESHGSSEEYGEDCE